MTTGQFDRRPRTADQNPRFTLETNHGHGEPQNDTTRQQPAFGEASGTTISP